MRDLGLTYLLATWTRDLRQQLVFRWSFILHAVSTLAGLLVFFLVDRFQGQLFGNRLAEAVAPLHTSYFGYVALGLVVSSFASMGLGGVFGQLGAERGARTLEYLMASPVSIHRWSIATGTCHLGRALFEAGLILSLAVGALGLRVPRFDPLAVLALVSASAVPLWGLSVLTLAGALIFRRGNILSFILGTSFELLGGVYAPTSALPRWLAASAELLPITPAVRALQRIVYQGGGLASARADLLQLGGLTLVYLPLAWYLLHRADEVSRKKGYYCLS